MKILLKGLTASPSKKNQTWREIMQPEKQEKNKEK